MVIFYYKIVKIDDLKYGNFSNSLVKFDHFTFTF